VELSVSAAGGQIDGDLNRLDLVPFNCILKIMNFVFRLHFSKHLTDTKG